MNTWVFGVALRREAGDHVVSVRDIPEVVTSGENETDALEQAVDAIEAALAFRVKRGSSLPSCSAVLDGEHPIAISARMAVKATVYEAWRAAGISKAELARRMGLEVVEVRRILEPNHGTKLDRLDQAARALGKRLTIGITESV